MQTSTITSKGQVTIPADLRKRFHLESGQRVEFVSTEEGVIIRPVLDDVQAAFGLVKAGHTVSLEEMQKAIEERAGE